MILTLNLRANIILSYQFDVEWTLNIELCLRISFTVINEFSDSHFLCVETILNNCPIFLINCYLQPSLNPIEQFNKLDRLISALGGRNFLMLGDFNSRSTLWGTL